MTLRNMRLLVLSRKGAGFARGCTFTVLERSITSRKRLSAIASRLWPESASDSAGTWRAAWSTRAPQCGPMAVAPSHVTRAGEHAAQPLCGGFGLVGHSLRFTAIRVVICRVSTVQSIDEGCGSMPRRVLGVLMAAVLAMAATGAPTAAGATPRKNIVYVSPDGKDGATGTRTDPLATVEQARDRLAGRTSERDPGTVYIREGVYQTSETIALSGKETRMSPTPRTRASRSSSPGSPRSRRTGSAS